MIKTVLKRTITVILLSGLLFISNTAVASAHIIRKDGDISAELHVKPYDHPVSGEPTTYLLSFEDEPASFNLDSYTTTITILEGTETISSTQLKQTSPAESENTITFPAAAYYTLRVEGIPKQTGLQPFTLSWPLRVTPGKSSSSIPVAVWVGGGVALVGIITAGVMMERSSRRNTPAN
jgi:hypothetical protein